MMTDPEVPDFTRLTAAMTALTEAFARLGPAIRAAAAGLESFVAAASTDRSRS